MTDLAPLNEASDDMRHRLREMIARGDPYFILTGSDPEDKAGCCPSNDVGEANRLARAGILETYGASFNSDCPVTIYAFSGEIHKAQDPPAFTVNQDLRASIQDRIDRGRTISRAVVLRAVLLLLAMASLVAFGVGLYRRFAR